MNFLTVRGLIGWKKRKRLSFPWRMRRDEADFIFYHPSFPSFSENGDTDLPESPITHSSLYFLPYLCALSSHFPFAVPSGLLLRKRQPDFPSSSHGFPYPRTSLRLNAPRLTHEIKNACRVASASSCHFKNFCRSSSVCPYPRQHHQQRRMGCCWELCAADGCGGSRADIM